MSLRDTTDSYGSVTRLIHWLTALLILVDWPLGLYSHTLAENLGTVAPDQQAAYVARTATLFSVHKTIGVTVLFLSVLRILWALTQKRPGLINGDHRLEAMAASVVHWLLYICIIALPLTGWIHHASTSGFAPILWPFGQSLPFVPQSETVSAVFSGLHWAFAWTLLGVLVLHVAGALKHHVIDRDATLRRMARGSAGAPSTHQPSHAMPAVAALVLALVVIGYGGLVHRPEAAPTAAAPELAEVDSDWQVQEGTLGLTVTQFGKEVTGTFGDWTADIAWNENVTDGVAGHVTVTVSVPSMTLGSVTKQALDADFLAAADHPTAVFDADLLNTPEGQRAEGTFTLKGTEAPLDFPFTLVIDGETAHATASFALDRRDYHVGDTMPDEQSVAFPVQISFDLTASRNSAP